jgi:hypothetical protein
LSSSQIKALQDFSHASGVTVLINSDEEEWHKEIVAEKIMIESIGIIIIQVSVTYHASGKTSHLHNSVAHHLALNGMLHLRQQRPPARLHVEGFFRECVFVVLALHVHESV